MAKTKAKQNPEKKYFVFKLKKRSIYVLLDKVLLFRYMRRVNGRFWGVTAVTGMVLGFAVCFAIRPDMLHIETAFSDFGNDVRTAPYFAGTVFFTAYGLWRWRKYLSHSWKRTMPVTGLITLTILGLYLVALMPISWRPVPYYIHLFGVSLAGVSMLVTVVLDGLLSHPRKTKDESVWWGIRWIAIIAIVTGGWLTLGSTDIVAWYDVALLGESLMIAGYFMWILLKTYHGEGRRTLLSKFLKDFVLID